MIVQLNVKHGVKTYKLELDDEAKVLELKQAIEKEGRILIRNQKLILKGKILVDSHSLKQANCTDGSKLMLMATGSKVPTDAPAAPTNATKSSASGTSGTSHIPEVNKITNWAERRNVWSKTGVISLRDEGLSSVPDDVFESLSFEKSVTNALNSKPQKTFNFTMVDLAHNLLRALPPSFSMLTSLRTLKLEDNCFECFSPDSDERLSTSDSSGANGPPKPQSIEASSAGNNAESDGGMSATPVSDPSSLAGLASVSGARNPCFPPQDLSSALSLMTQLTYLSLDRNKLTAVPFRNFSNFGKLEELNLSRNLISTIPEDFSRLVSLRCLNLDFNGLSALPNDFGLSAPLLEELSAKSNRIAQLPDSFGLPTVAATSAESEAPQEAGSGQSRPLFQPFGRLKKLDVSSNMIAAVPQGFFMRLTALHSLALHNNPLMMEALRETPGFAEFDKRRRRHVDKAIDGKVSVLSGSTMDQGADLARNAPFWNPDPK